MADGRLEISLDVQGVNPWNGHCAEVDVPHEVALSARVGLRVVAEKVVKGEQIAATD